MVPSVRHLIFELAKLQQELRDTLLGKQRYRALSPVAASRLQPYWIDLTFTLDDGSFRVFDPSGVPIRIYRDVGQRYNPTRIAGFALASWNAFLQKGERRYRDAFLRQANWFVKNVRVRGNALVWEYDFDWGFLRAPWISCMAQGEALSVLTRAFLLTGDRKYADTAEKAIRILCVQVEEGGVLGAYKDGSPCLEEYPHPYRQSHVLNGFIFALLGMYDFIALLNNKEYEPFFRECINSLARNLWRYDTGYWSRYDLMEDGINLSTFRYHDLHIAQLRALHYLTSVDVFDEFAIRWDGYRKRLSNRMRAFLGKVCYRIRHPVPR